MLRAWLQLLELLDTPWHRGLLTVVDLADATRLAAVRRFASRLFLLLGTYGPARVASLIEDLDQAA